MDSVEVSVFAYLFLGHTIICHDTKDNADCSVSKTTTNDMIFPVFLLLFHIQVENNHNQNIF